MRNNLFLVALLMILCIEQLSAQQEFFNDTNGFTVSGVTNFSSLKGGGVDIYLKNHVVISGMLGDFSGYEMVGASINFFITGSDYSKPTKGILCLSYTGFPGYDFVFGINAGLLHVFLKDTNYPLSLSVVANLTLHGTVKAVPVLSYTQSFLAHKKVYPVIGISYQIPRERSSYYSDREGAFFVHAGLNIKLDNRDSKL